MGGTSGHVALGIAFLIIGLWHLFNSIKLHSLHPKSYHSLPWFPLPRFRPMEPITIMLVTSIFILMELFHDRELVSRDGTIPSFNLPHVEHSIIALSFFVYAFFATLFDRFFPPGLGRTVRDGLLHFLQATAFVQQLLILHLHSTDHMGLEGQYHWLLQTVTFVSLITTLLSIGYPNSFLTSFVRAISVVFQGVWLIVMGIMLWTPQWLPKGCSLKEEPGRDAIVCRGDRALDRAKALVNVQFGLYLVAITVFSMCIYLVLVKVYPQQKDDYQYLIKCEEEEEEHKCNCLSKSSLPNQSIC